MLNSFGRRISGPYADKFAAVLLIAFSKMASNNPNGKSARAAVLIFFICMISVFPAFNLQVFLARWMGSEQFGILEAAIAISVAMLIGTTSLYIAVSGKMAMPVPVCHFGDKTIAEGYAI